MSNGDNVLDNWEEIDEAEVNVLSQALKTSSAAPCEKGTINSQSDIDLTIPATTASSSKPTQMKLLQRSDTQDSTTSLTSNDLNKSPLDDMSATFQPVMMVLHKPQDEYQSANYTAPIANQTVKILRRPTQSTEIRNNGIRPKQPIKTLQQREQEYAEARLRILGSAKNPEDDDQRALAATTTTSIDTSTTISTTTSPAGAPTVGLSNNTITSVVTTAKSNSPKMQIAANQYNSSFNQQLQQQQKYPQNYQQQQQQQQNYYYNQQQQPQPPAYNNNRTYNMNPLLTLGPMGPIGQPAQYQAAALSSPQAQQHFKYQQYQKLPQQQHKAQQHQQQQQTWSPVVGGSVSSTSIRQQPNDTILRLPRGPDGSTGFQVRR